MKIIDRMLFLQYLNMQLPMLLLQLMWQCARKNCQTSVLVFLFASPASAGGVLEQFVDKEDGAFDTSSWLLDRKGFLPLPIIVTEPAVDNRLGAALVFFHPNKNSTNEKPPSPSISAAIGLVTGNESWLVGGAHKGIWKNDSIRYVGALAVPSINLDFYGGGNVIPNDKPLFAYTLEGWFTLQEITFRIANTNFLAGGRLWGLVVSVARRQNASILVMHKVDGQVEPDFVI